MIHQNEWGETTRFVFGYAVATAFSIGLWIGIFALIL